MKKILITLLLLISSTATFAKDVTLTLEVPSMDCATCPITVKKALERVEGVMEVDVTFENNEAGLPNIYDSLEITRGDGTKLVLE